MKPDTVGEDEAVARLLLSVMEQRYDAAPPTPGWGQISGRLHRIRRRRRRRAAIGMGAGLLVLGVAGATMVTDVPDRHHAPPASTNGKSLDLNRRSPLGSDTGTEKPSVLDGRVRGSLAADRDWLQALCAQVAASKPWSYGGEQTWQPPTADAVSVSGRTTVKVLPFPGSLSN
jgi:hypothetical protein